MSAGGGRCRRRLVVPAAGQGERLDLFLRCQLSGVSRKQIKCALDAGRVFLDGRVVRRAGLLLAGGETLRLTLEGGPAAPPPPPSVPVLYRDGFLLAIDKPAGLPTHPAVAGQTGVLDLLTTGEDATAESPRPTLVHRLDADTSGVLLLALTAAANRGLNRQFAERAVAKRYLALVVGAPPPHLEVIDRLKPGVRGRTVRVTSGGQPAHTRFRTLATGAGFALVEARPQTGRTHQLRAHLAAEGYPLLGDTLYGGPASFRLPGGSLLTAARHLLHAARLEFLHPQTHSPKTVEAPLPADFLPFLEKLNLSDPLF